MDFLTSTSPTVLLLASLLAALVVHEIYTLIQRLYLSPIARFPGPKLAAATLWYQFYFDVLKRGRFLWEIERLHRTYGPIVRIGPNEVHILDPDFYDTLFAPASAKRDKDAFCIRGFGLFDSILATEKHDVHKIRRGALNPYFSKASVSKLEPLLVAKVDAFCGRLTQLKIKPSDSKAEQERKAVDLEAAVTALTTDVITEYCFAKGHGFLEEDGFAPGWAAAIRGSTEISNLGRYWDGLVGFMKMFPVWVVGALDPNLRRLVEFTLTHERQVADIAAGKYVEEKGALTHRTIIHELLESNLPPHEKTVARVAEEAQLLVAAGAVTTTHFLRTALFFVLSCPEILARLQAELKAAIPDPRVLPPVHKLEALQYLSAVVKETGRLTSGVSSRLARVAPGEDLVFQSFTIPAGITVSMSQPLQHCNPTVFPNPTVFDPERWLRGQESVALERYLVNFSKGARACVGINLAKAEVYLVLAAVVRRFGLELWEVERERDVDACHDWFVPYSDGNSKGVRVVVREVVG